MKKILLIQMTLLSSLVAEQGHQQGIARNETAACAIAKKEARARYDVFQMNSGCTCENTAPKEWICDLLFSYMPKKEKSNAR